MSSRRPAGAVDPLSRIGWWVPDGRQPEIGTAALDAALQNLTAPFAVLDNAGSPAVSTAGAAMIGSVAAPPGASPLVAYCSALPAAQLGDAEFRRDHRLSLAYVTGAMANGIASEALVEEISRAGMMGHFGAAGLSIDRIARALDRLGRTLDGATFGFDLIHSPSDPRHEMQTVELYLARRLRLVSASAFLGLTLPLVRYRVSGIHTGPDGGVVTPNRVMAKVSRVEVARAFFSPPPPAMLQELVADGTITTAQAVLAARVPVAGDLTAEADSGGHTDNRPAMALLPAMLALAARSTSEYGYRTALRVGAAGGISTPAAAAAAFALGAAYVMTGSVNQACVESGTSAAVRTMLGQAEQADTAMAPAADMFELGTTVQVLKRGTMFAMRAARLRELYRSHPSLESIAAPDRAVLEKNLFRMSLDDAWHDTRRFFAERDPAQIELAERDPKHKMALVFRSYLGRASRWATDGDASRALDYQIWCGPAMGAFNEWTRGTFLADPAARRVVLIAKNIMHSAAVITRIQSLRNQGVEVPAELRNRAPMTARQLAEVCP